MNLKDVTFDSLGFPMKIVSPDVTKLGNIHVHTRSKITRPMVDIDIDSNLRRANAMRRNKSGTGMTSSRKGFSIHESQKTLKEK